MSLSTSMYAALVAIGRQGKAWVGQAYPGVKVHFYDHHGIDLQARSLVALWKRGLITFEIHARLTAEGKQALEGDPRLTPGTRNFHLVERDE